MCISVHRGRLVRLFLAMLRKPEQLGKIKVFVIFLKIKQNYFNKNLCRCFIIKI